MFGVFVDTSYGPVLKYMVATRPEAEDAMAMLVWNHYDIDPQVAKSLCRDQDSITDDEIGHPRIGEHWEFSIQELAPEGWDFNWP